MPFGGFAPLPIRLGGTDSTEQWTPEQHARVTADLVALKRTLPFCAIRLDTTAPAISAHFGQGGSAAQPAISAVSTGVVDLTWSKALVDDYGITYPVFLTMAIGAASATTDINVRAVVTAPNVVRVYRTTNAGVDTAGTLFLAVW